MFRVVVALSLFVAFEARAVARFGVLFVAGAYSEVDPRQRGRTFEAQKRLLHRLGVPWRDVAIASTRPYGESAPIFAAAVDRVPWNDYLLMTFSMGGLVAEHAFVTDLGLARPAGWIAYQSPFYGVPLVDRANVFLDGFDPFRLRRFTDVMGFLATADATATEVREPHMRRYAREIRALTRRPVVCVTSENDELVPPWTAVLPGACEIRARGARHLDLTVGPLSYVHRKVFVDAFDVVTRCAAELASGG